jgi:hypothetical protein
VASGNVVGVDGAELWRAGIVDPSDAEGRKCVAWEEVRGIGKSMVVSALIFVGRARRARGDGGRDGGEMQMESEEKGTPIKGCKLEGGGACSGSRGRREADPSRASLVYYDVLSTF